MPFNPSLYLLQPPVGYGGQPLPWSDLKFNPLGLYSLRRRLGMLSDQRGIFTRYQQSFLASDLAWFAAGASEDKMHHVQPNTFHSLFGVSRENTPTGALGSKLRAGIREHLRQLTFDLATIWDRAYGGSTLVIHVEGATIPGAPNLPEYLKADVYLPPHLVDERPECHLPIATIVQNFIEEIGVPTVNWYTAAGRKFGWAFTQNRGYAIPSSPNLPLIPPPAKPSSAHYVFRGRPYGSLPLLGLPLQHSNSDSDPIPATPPSSKSTDEYFPNELDSIEFAMINAAEKIADLESGLERAALREAEYIKEINNLRNDLATYATLRPQEARSAGNISCSSTQFSSSPSLSYCVSPFTTPQPSKGKDRAVPSPSHCRTSVPRFPQLASLAYVSNSSLPEKVPMSNLSASLPIHRETLRRTNLKQDMESVTAVSSSILGPATTEFITTHNLTRFGQILSLIVANHPPTKWSAMLGVLSLSDNLHDGLLDALTVDLENPDSEAGN